MTKISPKSIKIIKTFNLYLCFFAMGLCFAVPGPTLIDLAYVVHTDIQNIAYIFAGRSIGCLCGSLIGGVLFDMTEKKQIVLTIFNFLTSISMFGIPFSKQIIILTVWMVVNGTSLGALVTGGNVCCLYLWGKHNGPFYQALHLAFGLGGFTAPLIAAPFLEQSHSDIDLINNSTAFSETKFNYRFRNTTFNSSSSIPSVTYAYASIGAFGLFVTILFFIMSFIAPKDRDEQENSDSSSSRRSFCFTCTLILLTTFLLTMSMGTEIGYAQMLTTYAVKGSLHLSTTIGSYMTSAYWISFTISRFITIFLAIKLTNIQLFGINIIIISAGSLILVCFAQYYAWAIWLSSVLLGSGISFFFPGGISWLDKYITVTSKIASIFSVFCALGEMLLPYIITQYINDKPEVFCYINVISCGLIVITVLIMYLMLKNVPDKYTLQEKKKEKDNDNVIEN